MEKRTGKIRFDMEATLRNIIEFDVTLLLYFRGGINHVGIMSVYRGIITCLL